MKERTFLQRISNWVDQKRNIRTARPLVEGLVLPPSKTFSRRNADNLKKGLTESVWRNLTPDGKVIDKNEILERVFEGGVHHSIRREVWPYLLEHYEFESTEEERELLDQKMRQTYMQAKQEWLEIEMAYRRREAEMAAYESDVSMPWETSEDGSSSETSKSSSSSKSSEESDSNPQPSCRLQSSSHYGLYATKLLDSFGLNLDRIDKDVERCDRHLEFFDETNLGKLRKILCTYVYQNLDMGYHQGMCDMAAPLLHLLDDEALTFACFSRLMSHASENFRNRDIMTQNYAKMRTLIQLFDTELYDLLHQTEDEFLYYYFCYRWFLLDFKREFKYEDLYAVWEVIWAARSIISSQFSVFIALSLVQINRQKILDKNMNFTDIFKFFNDLSESHDVQEVLTTARFLASKLQIILGKK